MSELSELFARDPLHLSDPDLAIIVARLRESQAQYDLGLKAPVADRPARSKKTTALLKDLGLE